MVDVSKLPGFDVCSLGIRNWSKWLSLLVSIELESVTAAEEETGVDSFWGGSEDTIWVVLLGWQ